MSEELDFLRDLGAQKIYEDTHISLKHVQSVIHESFEGLTKVQFLGFISILEREYNQDLSVLKEKGLEYFKNESPKESINTSVFIEPKRAKKPTFLYILIALLVFTLVAFLSLDSDSPTPVAEKIDNSIIVSAQQTIDPTAYESNSSNADTNASEIDENVTTPLVVVVKEEVIEEAIEPSLKIVAKSKLWIGYFNKTDNIKKQTIIKEFLELDPSKEWLLSLGHADVDIAVNGELQEFTTGSNIRFIYKNGELKQLNFRDFKILNEGRVW